MSKKTTSFSWLRVVAVIMAAWLFFPLAEAAKVTYNGINYYYSRKGQESKTQVDKWTDAPYTGDENGVLEIPASFEVNGTTYTVIATRGAAFQGCTELKEVRLPETVTTIGNLTFDGCTSLEVDPLTPNINSLGQKAFRGCTALKEVTIPATVTNDIANQEFAGSGLQKLTFADCETPIKILLGAFSDDENPAPPLEELVIHRNLVMGSSAYNTAPFHNNATLKRVIIGGEATEIVSDYFNSATALEEVIFEEGNKVNNLAQAAFSSCQALKSITLPAGITSLNPNLFYNCKNLAEVKFEGEVTSFGQYAFYNTASIKSFELPATLKTIGAYCFANGGLEGEVVIPEGVTAIGSNAFAGANAITAITLPATLSSIGDAAFAPISSLAAINLAEGNANFKMQDGALLNFAGTRLLVTTHEAKLGESLSLPDVTSIDTYGMAFAPFATIDMPALTTLNNYAFYSSALSGFTFKPSMTIGQYAFAVSALETLNIEEGVREIPQNLCLNCTALTDVNFASTVTNVMRNAFAGCTALEEMYITPSINYMESGAVPATIKKLFVLNVDVPVLADGVFTPEQSEVDCHVAPASVEKFKAAAQWSYLNILGDESISGEGATLGCPTGLYFTTPDGKLMYKDENGEVIDTEFPAGEHAFFLQSYKNRIYVAVAGKNFRYQYPTAGMGDGELFYVNKTNDLFYRVTVLNNVGYEAFQDPFSMTIIPEDEKIYISDRNVGIHEFGTDAVGLYGEQPFFMQNNWWPYYNSFGTSYGSITSGFTKRKTDIVSTDGATLNDVYWRSIKFNGFGIFRFTKDMLYSDGKGADHVDRALPVFFQGVQMTSFYIDEENGYLYLWVQGGKEGVDYTPGMYRVPLATLATKQNETSLIEDAMLIDDAPVKLEGSGDEITGVPQIIGDGKYVYWAYISPEGGTAVPNMPDYDAENPRHKTGIKRVNAVVEDPTVAPEIEYELEGYAAYGLALQNFVPDEKPEPQKNGDLNGDGNVNAGDVSELYTAILGGNSDKKFDLNGDGNVNAGDVSELYSIILSGE